MNDKKWAELPKHYQAALEAACAEANVHMQAKYDALNPGALRKLVGGGTQLRAFPPAVIEACQKAAAELYIKTENSKETLENVMRQIASPEIEFTVLPATLGRYASFMHEIGTVKTLYDMDALTMPDLHGKGGS